MHVESTPFYAFLEKQPQFTDNIQVYMALISLLMLTPLLNFNGFMIFRSIITQQNLKDLAWIISIIKYVHFFIVISIEFTQPTSYFIWKNESKSSIIQEVQEIGLIRFFQDQIRTKVAMAADLYMWLSKNKKTEGGY